MYDFLFPFFCMCVRNFSLKQTIDTNMCVCVCVCVCFALEYSSVIQCACVCVSIIYQSSIMNHQTVVDDFQSSVNHTTNQNQNKHKLPVWLFTVFI